MPIIKIVYTWFAMAGSFLIIDLLWLGVISKNIYKNQIGSFMRETPNWPATIIFYALFIVGVMIFCVLPAIEKNSLNHAIIYGGLFGFFTYMTYELTNLAVLKNWPLGIVFIDIIWGTFLTCIIGTVGYLMGKI